MSEYLNRPTMQMVADRAGVSLMTVSRSLKNNPRVSQKTRQEVLRAALELGYRPNPLVSALMAQIRHSRPREYRPTIAFLIADSDDVYDKADSYNAQIYRGAVARSVELGYKLERFSLISQGMSVARMRQVLRARGIPGIILSPLPDPIPALDFDWSGFACAAVGYSYKRYLLNRVANDQFNTMRKAVDKLLSLGFKRIGLAIRYEDDIRAECRWSGAFSSYFPHIADADNCLLPVFLWHYKETEEPVRTGSTYDMQTIPQMPDGFCEWVRANAPDAIISLQPLFIRSWLSSIKKDAEKSTEIINLNIENEDSQFRGMNQMSQKLGGAAVELVVEQIQHNMSGVPECAKMVIIRSEWQDLKNTRDSSGQTACKQKKRQRKAG